MNKKFFAIKMMMKILLKQQLNKKRKIINYIIIIIYIINFVSSSTLDIYKNARLGHRIVQTRYGRLHGLILPLDNYRFLRSVEAYLGVPYATPPTKQNRFGPTKAPAPWDGIRISDKYSPVCPQRLPNIINETAALEKMPKGRLEYLKRLMPFLQNQSEDCLYLNIFSPAHAATSEKKLPVIVFLHGESFEWSSGNPYDGSVLASYGEVVVVTLNYRLGLLGFLNANPHPQKRGRVANYGLMDQMAALDWIQTNIMNFGGDPQRVTLAGHGTGAACINFLMTSPMANQNGLFQRVILMSGSSYSSWALVDDPVIYAIKLAKEVNCSIPNDLVKQHEKIVDCLREVPLEDLFSADIQAPNFLTAFGPSVDGVVIHPGQSNIDLDDQIAGIRNSKRTSVPEKQGRDILFGVVTGEAIWRFSAHDIQNGFEGERRDKIIRTYVRNAYNYHLNEIFYTIVNEYTDWERTSQHPINTRDTAVAAISDAQFVAPLIRTGDMLAPPLTPQGQEKIGPRCYFYVFDYQTKDGDYPQRMGTVHGEDLPYIFGAPLVDGFSHFPSNYTKSEVALSEAVIIYWTNFARTGNPNEHHRQDSVLPASKERNRFRSISWDDYDSLHQKYLEIGMKPRIKNHFRAHQLSIWLRLIPELHKAGMEDVIARHNLFRNHDDLDMYDGLVKPDSISSKLNYLEDALKRRDGNDLILNGKRITTVEPISFTTCIPLSGNYTGSASFSPTTIVNATTDTLSGFEAAGYAAYSTALSVTIAIGCSLLILNVLIFAGVYYQRDKTRLEVKSLQKQYQQRGMHPHQQVPPFDPIKHAHYHMGHSQSANVIVDVENHHDQGTILLSNEIKSPHICSNTMQINTSCGSAGQNKIPLNESNNYGKSQQQQQQQQNRNDQHLQLKSGGNNQTFARPTSQCSGQNQNYNAGMMTLPKSSALHHSNSMSYTRASAGGSNTSNVVNTGGNVSGGYGDCMTLPRNISVSHSNNSNNSDPQQMKLPNGSLVGGVHHIRSTGPRPPIRTASSVATNPPTETQQSQHQHQHHQQQQTSISHGQGHHQHGPTMMKITHTDNTNTNQCSAAQNLQMTATSHLQQQVPQAAMDEMRV